MEQISAMSLKEIEALKLLIEEREEELYDEAWYRHTRLDDYIYKVHYANGEYCRYCKGADAYEEYLNHGTWIERYTKDLFPTYEFLMRKEPANEEDRVRQTVHEDTLQADQTATERRKGQGHYRLPGTANQRQWPVETASA